MKRAAQPGPGNANLVWVLLIPVVVISLYASAIDAPFAYDDRVHIIENPQVISFRGLSDRHSLSAFIETPMGWSGRPLLFLTYGWNYSSSGLQASAFRWLNIIIHTINALLVFRITWTMARWTSRTSSQAFWTGVAAGVLFAAHPLLTESVTYIAGRSSSLCGTFYFTGLLAIAYAGNCSGRRQWFAVAAVLACTAIGLLVKQDAITLLPGSATLIWFAWPKDQNFRRRLTITGILAAALGGLLILDASSMSVVSRVTSGNEALVSAGFEQTMPFVPYVLTSIKEWSFYYLWRLFVPVHLSVDPASAEITNPISGAVLLSIGAIAAMMAFALYFRRRDRLAAAAIILIVVSPLAAYCVFPLADVVAEHRAYITAIGAVMLAASAFGKAARPAMVAALAVVSYGWLTVDRNAIWSDEALLWEDAARKAPEKLRPHLNLASLYQVRSQPDRAIAQYEFVLARNPDHPAALSNLGALYLSMNERDKAEKLLEPAAGRQVKFAPVYLNLAVVRIQQMRFDEALKLLERAREINPRQLLVSHNRGDALANLNRMDLAIQDYLRELEINPTSLITHLHLARVYELTGSTEKAMQHYQIVLEADRSNREAIDGLARMSRPPLK
jgi:tetratricopeptide (TPR) repeat protein